MYFGHKYVETEPNCSHELATFPKYQRALKQTILHSNRFFESRIF